MKRLILFPVLIALVLSITSCDLWDRLVYVATGENPPASQAIEAPAPTIQFIDCPNLFDPKTGAPLDAVETARQGKCVYGNTLALPAPTTAPVVSLAPFYPMDDEIHGRFANDALLPENLDVTNCYRPWQAINPDRNGSKNATWIALLCSLQSSNQSDTSMIFVQPWELHVSGKGEFVLVLIRDLRAVEQLKARDIWDGKDPYDVSVAGDWSQQSDTLSVYFKGSGKILDAKSVWNEMIQSFYQVPFTKTFADGWIFHFDFGQGGNANLWIGSTEYVGGNTTLHSLFDLPVIKAK